MIEQELRELAAWYEWSEVPGYRVVAEALQDAADAMRVRALSSEAAKALITVWQPFVGREAAIGNPPVTVRLEDDTFGVLRYAVKDLGHMLKEAKSPEDRRRLIKRLNEQIANYERATRQEKGRDEHEAVA